MRRTALATSSLITLSLGAALVAAPATAAGGPALPALSDEQQEELSRLRAEAASQIQLRAFDLLDELVASWNAHPVFANDTPVILGGVTVPLGFGTSLEALIENHFAELVVKNPDGHVKLTHCPQCSALIVHSGQKGTIVARGIDAPEALAKAGVESGSTRAIFLDFEIEGSALVLRARITSLEPQLPVLYAHTVSSNTTTSALLRTGEPLKTAEQAHAEYVDTLLGRGAVLVPFSIGVRTFASPNNDDGLNANVGTVPQVWLMVGGEVALTQARAWTAGLSVGATWVPVLQTGGMVQARVARLLSGNAASLTNPDLYAFVGANITYLQGPGALVFKNTVPTVADLLLAVTGSTDASAIWGAGQVGVLLRVKNRISLGAYAEVAPTLADATGVGTFVDLTLFRIQSVGAEVAFVF